jgi:uncharacterized protein
MSTRVLETRSANIAGDAGRETRSFTFELKAVGDDGAVEGYGSVFGVRDSYGDVIVPGAFAKSLAEHKASKTNPAMLWQHNPGEPVGVWDAVEEDAKGLKLKGRIALDTTRGREAHVLMKMKALNGLSIGFVATEKDYDKDGNRLLTGIDLWEVSLVTFPANTAARITSVKSADVGAITTIRQAEKLLRDAGFSNDAAPAFIAQVKTIIIAERDARVGVEKATSAAERLLQSLKQ